mgnify:CR=1 FL=1
MKTERYFIIYKPVNMVSQFISTHQVKLLGDLNFDFPDGTHAIGRLDQHSEGLLLLTTNKKITKILFQGIKPHTRTYLVQVKNKVSKETAKQLQAKKLLAKRQQELEHQQQQLDQRLQLERQQIELHIHLAR